MTCKYKLDLAKTSLSLLYDFFSDDLVALSMLYIFKDVFIVDTKKAIIVWIGQETSMAERKNAMAYAHVSTCNKMIM